VAILWGIVGTGEKEDESSTGRVWAAGFHHVTARSRLARVMELISLILQIFWGPRMTETVGKGVHPYTHEIICTCNKYSTLISDGVPQCCMNNLPAVLVGKTQH
jgi:hypothetical protein